MTKNNLKEPESLSFIKGKLLGGVKYITQLIIKIINLSQDIYKRLKIRETKHT